MRFQVFLLAAVLASTGCSSPVSNPDGVADGSTFRLVRFDGQPLPVDQGPMPNRDGSTSPCRFVLADGGLSLDSRRERFGLHYNWRNSCYGNVLSQTAVNGRYLRSDGALSLVFDGALGGASGTLGEDELAIVLYENDLLFSDPRPAVDPIEGIFRLDRVEQTPIPVGPSPIPDDECPLIAESGRLSLEPATGLEPRSGRFQLEYVLRYSCTGAVVGPAEQSGEYEQIDRSLDFVAGFPAAPLFRGEIREGDIVLFRTGSSDLVFRR